MRIALLSQFAHPVIGGIENHVEGLANELRRIGHEVDVVAASIGGAMKLLPRPLWHLASYDVVHYHGFDRLILAQIGLLKFRKLVATPHGGMHSPTVQSGIVSRVRALSDRMLFSRVLSRNADAVIVLDAVERAECVKLGMSPSKIAIIPNGIDVTPFSALAQTAEQPDYLVFVGRVAPIKRIDLMIELLMHIPAIDLKIVGPCCAKDMNLLMAHARKHGVERRVIFLGPKHGAEKAALQANAVANLLLSDYERQPLSILEAAAAGTMSIARKVGGVPQVADMLPGAVHLVDDLDEAANVIAAVRRASQMLRAERAAALRASAAPFSWPVIARQVERVYIGN